MLTFTEAKDMYVCASHLCVEIKTILDILKVTLLGSLVDNE